MFQEDSIRQTEIVTLSDSAIKHPIETIRHEIVDKSVGAIERIENTRQIAHTAPTEIVSQAQQPDTLAPDTLISSDTIRAVADSIPSEPIGFVGKFLPNDLSSDWVFLIFGLLILLLSIAVGLSRRNSLGTIKSFFSSKHTHESFLSGKKTELRYYFIITLFTAGVWAFAISLFFNGSNQAILFKTYLYRIGLLLIFVLAKHLLFTMVGRTLFSGNFTKVFKENYFTIFFYSAVLLLPILIGYVYVAEIRNLQILWILLVVVVFAYSILIFKILQLFYSKVLDLFYIFLYFCTLELLPLVILIRANELIDF